jgi:SAM-dependent methyltransferase
MNSSKGRVNLGDLRRVTPISRFFGCDRGRPVDRYYIENFLSSHAQDVGGRILEFGDDYYTRDFGGDRVTRSDVLDKKEGNPLATIVADLSTADHIPDNTFDCIICTQTLIYIYEINTAIRTLYRILKPHGVLLATFPGICQISREDMEEWGDYWRFTTLSANRLFAESFAAANVSVRAFGNVLSAVAFLHGMVTEELKVEELDYSDTDYELVITVRAVKMPNTFQPEMGVGDEG